MKKIIKFNVVKVDSANKLKNAESSLNNLPESTKHKLPKIVHVLETDYLPVWNEIKSQLV